jgi:hypothetical protein
MPGQEHSKPKTPVSLIVGVEFLPELDRHGQLVSREQLRVLRLLIGLVAREAR